MVRRGHGVRERGVGGVAGQVVVGLGPVVVVLGLLVKGADGALVGGATVGGGDGAGPVVAGCCVGVGAEVAGVDRGVGAAVVAALATSELRLMPGGTSSRSMAWMTPFVVITSGPVTVASLILTTPLPTTTSRVEPWTDCNLDVEN